MILKKNEELCSLSLVDTVILDQCANGLPQFENKSCHFPSSNFWNIEEFDMNIFWVFQNQENCLHPVNFSHVKYFQILEIQILLPFLFRTDFPGYRGLQYEHNFLVFWVISNFFKCQKPHYSRHGLPVNSHANFTYSFPTLKIILIPTMTRSNHFWFISLIAHTAPPMPESQFLYVT
jgi:hypothetical protein